MSTRSYIGMKNEDGSIDYVYCHCDGYPEFVGTVLKECYTDSDDVKELIALGGISVLGEIPLPDANLWNPKKPRIKGKTISTGYPLNKYCCVYTDRGEPKEITTALSEGDYLKKSGSGIVCYSYLFKNGEWLMWGPETNNEFKPF